MSLKSILPSLFLLLNSSPSKASLIASDTLKFSAERALLLSIPLIVELLFIKYKKFLITLFKNNKYLNFFDSYNLKKIWQNQIQEEKLL